jgi:hypothetical protein
MIDAILSPLPVLYTVHVGPRALGSVSRDEDKHAGCTLRVTVEVETVERMFKETKMIYLITRIQYRKIKTFCTITSYAQFKPDWGG